MVFDHPLLRSCFFIISSNQYTGKIFLYALLYLSRSSSEKEGLSKSDCPKSLMERNLARHKAGYDEST